MKIKAKRILIPLAIVFNTLACWIHFEAVVKPLKSCCPQCMNRMFPSPFYLWWAPIWFWHDLAYTLIVIGTLILGYYAIKNGV